MRKQTSIILSRSELEGVFFGLGVTSGPDWKVEGLSDGGISIFWSETIFPSVLPFSLNAKLPADLTEIVRNFCDNREPIKAIKEVRTRTNWGLKQAKDWVVGNFPQCGFNS